jgi:hypothetical protein
MKHNFGMLQSKQDNRTPPYAHNGRVSIKFEEFNSLDFIDQKALLDDWIATLQVYRDAVIGRNK